MPTPRALRNFEVLGVRRRGFETTRTPAPSALSIAGRNTALVISDNIAPSVPTGVSATATSSSAITVSWNASTDTGGSGLAGYRIYRNGSSTPLAQTSSTSFGDTGLSASTVYTYRVTSYDNQGNESTLSSQASATTQSAGGGSLFLDNFNSGSRSAPQNGISWGAVNIGPGDGSLGVVSGVGYNGTPGLRYRYLGTGTQRFVEQRMDFAPGIFTSACWMRFKFWVPANYNHTGGTNDKFWLAIWGGPYDPRDGGPTTPGMDINMWDIGGGQSGATVYFFNRIWSAHTWGTYSTPMIRTVDFGRWMDVVIGYELPTGPGAYGRCRIWRDGGITGSFTKVIDVVSNDATASDVRQGSNWLPEQSYLDQAYLMGYANSPQSQTYDFIMDDVELNTTNTYGVA